MSAVHQALGQVRHERFSIRDAVRWQILQRVLTVESSGDPIPSFSGIADVLDAQFKHQFVLCDGRF